MQSKLFLVFSIVFLIGLVSANGLSIDVGTISINKTSGQDLTFNISITNDENFDFYNITLEDNNYMSMIKIPELKSGHTASVDIVLDSDEDISDSFNIYGYYESQVGASDETYNIDVDFTEGLSRCSFSIIEGDQIVWNNTVPDSITLKNMDTYENVYTIQEGNSYEKEFISPTSFRYQFYRMGMAFTNICTISVLDDFGYVNNPDYDASFNLEVDIIYEQTTLESTFLNTDFSMNFLDVEEGMFMLTNIGDEDAKNINLNGEWIYFSSNNFDLEPGKSKTIGYTINPLTYIQNTSQTNQTYNKTISITGNFPTIEEKLDIFIEYSEIVGGEGSVGQNFQEWFTEYCEENPTEDFCEGKVIYRYYNNGSEEFNVTTSQEQMQGLFKAWITFMDDMDNQNKYAREKEDNITETLTLISSKVEGMEEDSKSLKDKIQDSNEATIFLGITASTILVICCIFFIGWHFYKKRLREGVTQW